RRCRPRCGFGGGRGRAATAACGDSRLAVARRLEAAEGGTQGDLREIGERGGRAAVARALPRQVNSCSMDFRIADTFLSSLERLTGEEQKQVKITAFDLQANPANPGHKFHKLDRARDRNFWSVRVGSDIRLIVHKTSGSLLLCYVDHHDKAYAWAERRRMEVHPATGAAQIVEVRETVKEIVVPRQVESAVPTTASVGTDRSRRLFENLSDGSLLRIGVPRDWIADV